MNLKKGKWRELKYYAHGTPTKTAMKYRRRHLFIDYSGSYYSPCGLIIFTSVRFSGQETTVQKCKHCLKHVAKSNG